ncbi:tRNA wybutosine-synthesizing protein [Colletotrichum karsti]|uniref:tRNA wybutosine-synthesizing protein 2 n=1 Tax=Colletotrichum karsti TaxID=1095194 RepID=A0A9P6LLU9_9PEZI|nr:tRNA wybutosine-synthesizing protein [Colletotrichum karsti]KAF9877620.1 tRNA wybutosine-synthesizing protein [Colletotrichum karsti]
MSLSNHTSQKSKPRGKKSKPENPIIAAVRQWLTSLPPQAQSWSTDDELKTILDEQTPKRYTTYTPMVLLPSGSFNKGHWPSILSHPDVGDEKLHQLWEAILQEILKTGVGKVSHLAVNEGIPPQTDPKSEETCESQGESENILRTPGGLRILHGDFGPSINPTTPSTEDFEAAFWVSTKQNGIFQTWAPRWTMFSRGNIKEKTRLLEFYSKNDGEQSPLHRGRPDGTTAVDLYAGIGYFTFSYAKLGMKVLCWELNPWSVEALRRGAVANGWKVKVVQGADLELPSAQLFTGEEQIIVFLQDNREAARGFDEMCKSEPFLRHTSAEPVRSKIDLKISHINGGLLPTSEPSWRTAWDILAADSNAWLHLHENVGVKDIENRSAEIERMFQDWAADANDGRGAKVEHVELVKTYAPDVWHCVFDVHITAARRPM